MGEIFIEGDTVFPNARRDGLEDTTAWRDIEGQILAEIVPLAREAYKASRERKTKDFDKVKLQTDTEIKEVEESLKPKANHQADEPHPDRKETERKLNADLKRRAKERKRVV